MAQRIITNIKSGKYPVILNHPITATLQTSYNEYDVVYTKQFYSGKGKDVAYNSLKAFFGRLPKASAGTQLSVAGRSVRFFKTFGLDLDRFSYSDTTLKIPTG